MHETCSTFCLSCFIYFHNLPSLCDHPRLLKSTKTALTLGTLLEGMPASEKHERNQGDQGSSQTAMQVWSQTKGRTEVWKNTSLTAMWSKKGLAGKQSLGKKDNRQRSSTSQRGGPTLIMLPNSNQLEAACGKPNCCINSGGIAQKATTGDFVSAPSCRWEDWEVLSPGYHTRPAYVGCMFIIEPFFTSPCFSMNDTVFILCEFQLFL